MRRPARIATVFFALASALVVYWFWPRAREPARHQPNAFVQSALGGKSLELEIFAPHTGRLLWRLHINDTTVAGGQISANGIRARYFGTTSPASFAAARFEYIAAKARAVFRGDVHVAGSRFTLDCAELVWDRAGHSFRVDGGYVLTRDGSSMHGEKLLASEDWQSIRAVGAVRLTTVQAR